MDQFSEIKIKDACACMKLKISRMCPTGGSLSVSLGNTAAGLINNPLHTDLKIVGQNKTYHGHKVIL